MRLRMDPVQMRAARLEGGRQPDAHPNPNPIPNPNQVTFHDLIKMCSGELMQELVLRLGGAADHGAYTQTVRALNTLIPVAMANSSAEADEAGDGMLSGQVLQP